MRRVLANFKGSAEASANCTFFHSDKDTNSTSFIELANLKADLPIDFNEAVSSKVTFEILGKSSSAFAKR